MLVRLPCPRDARRLLTLASSPSDTRWSREEASTVEGGGQAAGWTVDYLRSTSAFPELAMDPANVAFAKAGGRKRSRH
jgi:hypothetical protein